MSFQRIRKENNQPKNQQPTTKQPTNNKQPTNQPTNNKNDKRQ